jgi:heat shock protein HtpX
MINRTTGSSWGLRLRMLVVMGLLAGLYLAFLSFLSSRGVSVGFLMVIAGAMLGAQYFFSDKLALWGMKAKVVSPEQEPELHAMVERVAVQAGIPKPRVAISKMPILNAFATGRNPRKAVVAVTEALMQYLGPREVEAVIGHEVCHVKHRDVAVMTFASFFAMVAFFLMRSFLFMGMFGGGRRSDQGGPGIMVVWLVSMAVWLVSQVLILALGRYRELYADREGAHLTGRPEDLASALLKISRGMEQTPARTKQAVKSMNAFFIVPTSLKELFSTHPPLETRLQQLDEIRREMGR